MADKTVDQQALQERYVEMQLIDRESQQIRQHLQMVDEQIHEVRHNTSAINDISKIKPGEDILVPIANGIFAKGTIKNTKNLLVGVGASIVVQKDIQATIGILDKRLTSLEAYQTELSNGLAKLEGRAREIEQEMRGLAMTQQQ